MDANRHLTPSATTWRRSPTASASTRRARSVGRAPRPLKRLFDGVWVNGIANSAEADLADIRRDELLRNDSAHGLGQLHL